MANGSAVETTTVKELLLELGVGHAESVALNVTVYVPDTVGTPEISPSGLSVSPAGRDPPPSVHS